MRYMACALLMLSLGCGGSAREAKPGAARQATPVVAVADQIGGEAAETAEPGSEPASPAGSPGSDWPRFLGPAGTSVSTETGIIAPWPATGLRIIWHKRVG